MNRTLTTIYFVFLMLVLIFGSACTKDTTPKDRSYANGEQVGVKGITLEFMPPLTVTGVYYSDYKNVYYNLVDANGKKFSNVCDKYLERYNP